MTDGAVIDIEPTEEELRFIKKLDSVLKTMPKSVWIFCADSGLIVMRRGKLGEHVVIGDPLVKSEGGVDPDYVLSPTLAQGKCDGGDW
jgi:hypothetical protein